MDAAGGSLPKSYKWYQVWGRIYRHPFKESFREILEDPTFHVKRAFFWIVSCGAVAGLLCDVASGVQGNFSSKQLGVGAIIGLVLSTMALLIISLNPFYSSRKLNGQLKTKNQLVYCNAAALSPAALIYGLLLAAGQVLPKIALFFDPVLNVLAIITTGYLFWLLNTAFKALTDPIPGLIRELVPIYKSLAVMSGLLVLTMLGVWILPSISLIFKIIAVILFYRLLDNLIEIRIAKLLSIRGQVGEARVVKKRRDQWQEPAGKGRPYSTHYAYYVTYEFMAGGLKKVVTSEVTSDEYEELNEGSAKNLRYSLDRPEYVQFIS